MNEEFFEKYMMERIDSICMSIRHDYGLMLPVDKEKLRFQTKKYIHAISKEVPEDTN